MKSDIEIAQEALILRPYSSEVAATAWNRQKMTLELYGKYKSKNFR